MEGLERIIFFPYADELDGLPGNVADGERGAATGIAIHLGEDHAGQRELLVELVGRVDGVLAGHGVGDEEDLLRVEELLERLHLVHELIIDMQASGSVNDKDITTGVDGV